MKRFLLLLYVLFDLVGVGAQTTPPVIVDQTGTDNAYNFELVDWDADGDLDYLNIAQPGFQLAWIENLGGGQLAPQVILDQAFFYHQPLLADFNGDNRLDLVLNNFQSGQGNDSLVIRLQLANGTFGPAIRSFRHSNQFKDFALADCDADGDVDFVRADASALLWYENDGAGNFEPPHFLADPTGEVLHVADVNADGLDDLLVEDLVTGKIYYFQNLGGGNFKPKTLAATLPDWLERLISADLDGDGLPDLLPLYRPDGVFTLGQAWLKNLGNGQFAAPQALDPSANWVQVVVQATASDLDNDGDTDMVALTRDTLLWFENTGGGQFAAQVLAIWPEVTELNNLTSLDLDADGWSDLIAYSYSSGTSFFKNEGGGLLAPRMTLWPKITGFNEVAAADLDQDGLTDILAVSTNDGRLVWYPGLGAGQFGPFQELAHTNYQGAFARIADLDGDGDVDVLSGTPPKSTNLEAFQLGWYRNDGTGHFDAALPVVPGNFYFPVTTADLADLDGDGHTDVVCLALGAVCWLRNDGAGGFGFPQFAPPVGYVYSYTLSDLDDDGDKDILVDSGAGVAWYKNDGNGQFGDPILLGFYGVNYLPAPLQVDDLDGDGDQDILDGGNNWHANRGDNTFDPGIPMDPPAFGARLADLNQDGKPDLVGGIGWRPNIGHGIFEEQITLYGKNGTSKAVDLDGNGDLEILYTTGNEVGYFDALRGLPYISGHCFWDWNENGQRDSSEPDLPGIAVTLDPTAQLSYPYTNGKFRFYVAPGAYELGYLPHPCWTLTTDSASWHIAFADTAVTGLYFGFKPGPGASRLEAFVASSPMICGQSVRVWLNTASMGCRPAAGRLSFMLSSNVSFLGANYSPDVISGDTLSWQIDTLIPGGVQGIEVYLDLAVVPPGDTLSFHAFLDTYGDDGTTVVFRDTFGHYPVVLCAYDPNDKAVDRPTLPPDYLVAESELAYTVRFQNTGNYPAANIRILDTLDAGLDWTTLRPLAASHAFYLNLDVAQGIAEFNFPNIFLADSLSNELASHGFVSFTILPKAALAEGTVIPNRAGIYFDFNPPVLTNYAQTEIKTTISVRPQLAVAEGVSFFPNPTSGLVHLQFRQPPGMARVRIFDLQGRLCLEKHLAVAGESAAFDVSGLLAAAYLLEVLADNGEQGRAVLVVQP